MKNNIFSDVYLAAAFAGIETQDKNGDLYPESILTECLLKTLSEMEWSGRLDELIEEFYIKEAEPQG